MSQLVSLHINGVLRTVAGDATRSLLDVLREDLRLTGTKRGCGIGACGSCTVLVDGKPRRACRLKLEEVARYRTPGTRDPEPGTGNAHTVSSRSPVPGPRSEMPEIITIEGLADGGNLHPVQQAFVDCGAIQCGFCTPGMVLTAKALLDSTPNPTRDEIRKALAGNLCRCTGYQQIFEAIEEAARRMRAAPRPSKGARS